MIYLFSKRQNFLSYPDKRGATLCKIIVIEIVTEFRLEIGIEQTQLFHCNRFHYAENRQSPSHFLREMTAINQC